MAVDSIGNENINNPNAMPKNVFASEGIQNRFQNHVREQTSVEREQQTQLESIKEENRQFFVEKKGGRFNALA